MKNKYYQDIKFLVAGYGLPAEFTITHLFGSGILPHHMALLTHKEDFRNLGLRSLANLRCISMCDAPAKSEETFQFVQKFSPDIILSMHYRELIPNNILSLSKFGSCNLHPSLLPKYRGTNSVQWVLINGENETGYTYHRMGLEFDTGTILVQKKIPISNLDTAFSLFNKLIVHAMFELDTVIEMLINNELGSPQVGNGSYFHRKLPFNGIINPAWSIDKIEKFIRAMIFPPFSCAILECQNERYEIRTVDDFYRLQKMIS